MRTLLCVLGIVLFFSSCQLHVAHIINTKPQPFVQLKDGTMIHTNKVEWTYESFQHELVAKGKAYDRHMISFYSDGTHSFANVGKKNFAEMISEGKINVYKTQNFKKLTGKKTGYGGGPYLRQDKIWDHYYIQNRQRIQNRAVVKMNFKNVATIIPHDAMAYRYVAQYRHQRKFTNITLGIGGVALIGGAALTTLKGGKINYQGIGLTTMGVGAAIAGASIAWKIPYKARLFRIVDFYN